MAGAFRTETHNLEKELATLIGDDKIQVHFSNP